MLHLLNFHNCCTLMRQANVVFKTSHSFPACATMKSYRIQSFPDLPANLASEKIPSERFSLNHNPRTYLTPAL